VATICGCSGSSGSLVHDVDRLFRAYNEMLVRYLTRRLGDRDWAEEVAQETFVRALRQETMTNERAWLFTVANNLVRDEARKDLRRRRHLTLLFEEERERVTEPEETAMERAQDAAMARAAVDGLAERDRLALLMREEGLDYSEIASALGLSAGSVGTTLARARRRLVEQYERLQQEQQRREGNAAS
jgi:RNA polymerase sigma-70 factor, ECF subfamily